MFLDAATMPEDAPRYLAYLDGELVPHAKAAHEEEGWVDIYETYVGATGINRLVLDQWHKPVIERRFGVVELRRKQ